MLREFTCIICPNGCEISAEIECGKSATERIAEGCGKSAAERIAEGCGKPAAERCGETEIRSIQGALCPKGRAYVEQELTDPQRNIATSVLVKGGNLPLASVRLTSPIPKDRIFDAMAEIKKCALTAPVQAGTVVIHNLLGFETDVIVTKMVGV